jgi:hypothetical protein
MASNKQRTEKWNKTLYEFCFAVHPKLVTPFSPDLSTLGILCDDSDTQLMKSRFQADVTSWMSITSRLLYAVMNISDWARGRMLDVIWHTHQCDTRRAASWAQS